MRRKAPLANLAVFAWRRRYQGAAVQPTELQLMPITVVPDQPVRTALAGASELIEIVLAGYRVRVVTP